MGKRAYVEWKSPGGVKIRQKKEKHHRRGTPIQVYHIFDGVWYTIRELVERTGIVKTTLHSWLASAKTAEEFFTASGSSYEYDPTDVADDGESRQECTPEQNALLDAWDLDYEKNPNKWQ